MTTVEMSFRLRKCPERAACVGLYSWAEETDTIATVNMFSPMNDDMSGTITNLCVTSTY